MTGRRRAGLLASRVLPGGWLSSGWLSSGWLSSGWMGWRPILGRATRGGIVVLVLAASGPGCSAGRAAVASKADYRDYRETRLVPEGQARAVARAQYIEAHPEGRWADEVAEERRAFERPFFEARRGTRDGLLMYLEAYPDGRWADEARARLTALAALQTDREAARASRRTAAEEERAEVQRTRLLWGARTLERWLELFVGLDGWGDSIQAIARRNPAFDEAFGRSAPDPTCTPERCDKPFVHPFAIPMPGQTLREQTLTIVVRLRFGSDNALVGADLLLPNFGFSRWYELEQRVPVEDLDPNQREGAVSWARERMAALIERVAPHAQRPPETSAAADASDDTTVDDATVSEADVSGMNRDDGPVFDVGPLRLQLEQASPDPDSDGLDRLRIDLRSPAT